MKALSVTGFAIATLIFLLAMYLQFMVAPGVEMMEATTEATGFDELNWALQDAAREGMMNLAYVVLLGGGLALILSVVGFLKTKNKLALAGGILSLISVFIGLAHGTHMFS